MPVIKTVISHFMFSWYKKRKLKSLVTKLAIYNDKGIAWSRDTDVLAEEKRSKLLASIQSQISSLGNEHVPSALLEALKNGSLKTDVTGKFIPYK